MYAWFPWRSEETLEYPGTGVTHSYEPPCGCWESNPGPLQEQQVLLTAEQLLLSYYIYS